MATRSEFLPVWLSASECGYVLLRKDLQSRVLWLRIAELGAVWLSSHTFRTPQTCDIEQKAPNAACPSGPGPANAHGYPFGRINS